MKREEVKSAIIGMTLGDGTITKQGVFKCSHSIRQRGYLDWKKSILQNLFDYEIKTRLRTVSNQTGKSYPICEFATRQHPRLRQIYKLLYDGNGRKEIRRSTLDRLTPLGIAIWYMDDGCMPRISNRNGGEKKYRAMWLHTNSFTYEENEIIRDWFAERDIHFNIKRCRQTYYLGRGMSGTYRLLEIVRPHIHPELAYKIDFTPGPRKFYSLRTVPDIPQG